MTALVKQIESHTSPQPLTARVSPRSTARPQDEIDIAIDPNRIHLFDKETENTIMN